jgi:hypothetical protein
MSRRTSIVIVLDLVMVALIALSMSGALTPGSGPASPRGDMTVDATQQATNPQQSRAAYR